MPRIVEVLPYNAAWPAIYSTEAARIADELGPNLVATHHIGSTAVPGLAAKPTIDILLVVRELDALDACNEALQDLGYRAKGENGIPGRRYFQKLEGDQHLYHIHAFEKGHPEIIRHLNFRDYLIAHPHIARAYQQLKQRLAAQFRDAPARYTQGKDAFIRSVNVQAADWRTRLEKLQGGEA